MIYLRCVGRGRNDRVIFAPGELDQILVRMLELKIKPDRDFAIVLLILSRSKVRGG